MSITTVAGVQTFAATCQHLVALPGDTRYDALRSAWNLAVDVRPAAVAAPESSAEVAAIVRAAHDAGLRIAVQGTGHNPGPLVAQGLDDVVLLVMSAMRGVRVDPDTQVAHVGGGAVWDDVMAAATPHGLVGLHGSSGTVGVVGYSLNGGTGWYARQHGLACHSIVGAEIVTPAGEIVEVDAEGEPDLLWALRGAGTQLGVVTRLSFRLYPIETAWAGALMWDLSRAPEVLPVWADWCRTAPDEVSTSLRLLRFPPLEMIPEPLRGRSFVGIDGAVLADDARAQEILAPLTALDPAMNQFGRVPAAVVAQIHGDPEDPSPGVGDSVTLRELTPDTIDALLAVAGPNADSHLLAVELRQLGGAVGRPSDGALSHLDAAYAAYFVGMAPVPEAVAALHAETARVAEALRPWASEQPYLNFREGPAPVAAAYSDPALRRIRDARDRVDPMREFVPGHRLD